jgi:hypothetical protein
VCNNGITCLANYQSDADCGDSGVCVTNTGYHGSGNTCALVSPCNGGAARLARRDLGILLPGMSRRLVSEPVKGRGLEQGQNRRVGRH